MAILCLRMLDAIECCVGNRACFEVRLSYVLYSYVLSYVHMFFCFSIKGIGPISGPHFTYKLGGAGTQPAMAVVPVCFNVLLCFHTCMDCLFKALTCSTIALSAITKRKRGPLLTSPNYSFLKEAMPRPQKPQHTSSIG